MRTVGRLAERFGLSRSTLLYYDSIGLLRPSRRSPSGYRLYDDADELRLRRICRYRQAGLRMEEIRKILDAASPGSVAEVLERRLEALNEEIGVLREQQRVVVRLLARPTRLRAARAMDKQAWVRLLRATGLDETDMRRWHIEFERQSPEAHRDFLESLGIATDEITEIRRWARAGARKARERRENRS